MAQRTTAQMTMTLRAVIRLGNHPTAEQVWELIHTKNDRVSRATVYRNLNKLCRARKIKRVRVFGRADRFDYRLKPHYHLVCSNCGRVEDVEIPPVQDMRREAQKALAKQGGVVTGRSVIFEGLCSKCRKACRNAPGDDG